jgi:hypothetical protein
MSLRFAVSASLSGQLARRFPAAACKNVFGDASEQSVCLCNPDVEAYLTSLVRDLNSRAHRGGVTVHDFVSEWGEARSDDWCVSRPLQPCERRLFSICFCESCHQGAEAHGLDFAAIRNETRSRILQAVSTKPMRGVSTVVGADGSRGLAAYREWQKGKLAILALRLSQSPEHDNRIAIHFADLSTHEERTSSDVYRSRLVCIDSAGQLASLPGTSISSAIGLSSSLVVEMEGADLVSGFQRLAAADVSLIEVDNYGVLPQPTLVHLKQAIRFARRTS